MIIIYGNNPNHEILHTFSMVMNFICLLVCRDAQASFTTRLTPRSIYQRMPVDYSASIYKLALPNRPNFPPSEIA